MHNPFTAFPVTQGFSDKHRAIDYGMPIGTPLPAPSAGRVVYEWFQDAGYTATIHRPDGSWTRYAHGSPHGFPRPHTIREREHVRMLSGNSGKSTGPHLHAFDVDARGIRRPPFTTGLQLAGDDPNPTIEGDSDMPLFLGNNIVTWPNGYSNAYRADVYEAMRLVVETGDREPSRVATLVRESWAATNFIAGRTAEVTTKSVLSALEVAGVGQGGADVSGIVEGVLEGMPTPEAIAEATVDELAGRVGR